MNIPAERTSLQMDYPLYGLVLAGGQSTRMGFDKCLIDYHGMPQLDYATQLLQKFTSFTFLSTSRPFVSASPMQVIKDTFIDMGPYGGVLSAFEQHPDVGWLTIACDLPLVDEECIQQLMDEREVLKIATCFQYPDTGFPEPLITVWEPRAYRILLDYLEKGFTSLNKVLQEEDVKKITPAEPAWLLNANSQKEVEEIRRMISLRRG